MAMAIFFLGGEPRVVIFGELIVGFRGSTEMFVGHQAPFSLVSEEEFDGIKRKSTSLTVFGARQSVATGCLLFLPK